MTVLTLLLALVVIAVLAVALLEVRRGLRSIATGGDAYPQLSAEFILETDPALIFLADGQCCGVTPETVAARAGWGELTAVRDGQVYVLDEDVAEAGGELADAP